MVTTQSQSQQLQSEIAGRPKISPRSVPPATNATASPVSNEDMTSAAAVKLSVQYVFTADERIVQAKNDTATNDIHKVTFTILLDTASSAQIVPYVQQVGSPTDVANSIRTRDKILDQEIEPTLTT